MLLRPTVWHTNPLHIAARKPFLLIGWLAPVLLLLASANAGAQMPSEKPKGYVSDFAGVLSEAARQRIETLATELDQKAHAQLAVVTVKSLEGKPIEDFSIDLATKWGIGRKAKQAGDQSADQGVLLLLAVEDRRDRIEVGYSLEPILPDARAGDILRAIAPYLRNGDYDSGLLLGAGSIASVVAQAAGVQLDGPMFVRRAPSHEAAPISPLKVIGVLLFLLPFLLLSRRGPMGGFGIGGPYLGGGYGGGGWGGGGGGGGGGFGGFGGGSFGGGGASGNW